MEPENTPLEKEIIFPTIMSRFYVILRGCIPSGGGLMVIYYGRKDQKYHQLTQIQVEKTGCEFGEPPKMQFRKVMVHTRMQDSLLKNCNPNNPCDWCIYLQIYHIKHQPFMYWNVSYAKLVRLGCKTPGCWLFSTFPGWKKGAFLSTKIPKKNLPKTQL